MLNAFPQQRRLLMANQSTMSPDDSNSFGPHHFVENCCLNLRVRNSPGGATTNASCHAETVTGGAAVAERLAKLSVEDEIVFNANLDDEGCKGKKRTTRLSHDSDQRDFDATRLPNRRLRSKL